MYRNIIVWMSLLAVSLAGLAQVPPSAISASRCGFWSIDGKPAEKDLRLQLTAKVQVPNDPACTGQFTVHNDTTVFDKVKLDFFGLKGVTLDVLGPSGYTLELRPDTKNVKLVWAPPIVGPNNVAYLIPKLDLDFLPVSQDPNQEAHVTIKGYMTVDTLKIDRALLILHAALTSTKTNCLLPPEMIARVAVRASGVAGADIGLMLKGHIPSKQEMQQFVTDFLKKAQDVFQELKVSCAKSIISKILGSPATVVQIAASIEGVVAMWIIDIFRYWGASADAPITYMAPPKTVAAEPAKPAKPNPPAPVPAPVPAPKQPAPPPAPKPPAPKPPSPPAPVPQPPPAPAPPATTGPGPVMAFYYPWYEPTDWASGKMSDTANPTYSGGDDDAMRRHIQQADDAGIDALVCAWYGPHEDRINKRCHRLLQLVQESGRHIRVAVFPDPASFVELYTPGKMAEALDVIRKEFTPSPAYFTWQDKPVVFFYHPPSLGDLNAWKQLRDQADPNHDQIWLGGTDDFSFLDVYDALFYFDISWEKSNGAAMASYVNRLKSYNKGHNASKPFIATAQAGYDDTLYRGQGHVVRDRANGDYYRGTWQTVSKLHAAAVVLTSFNEFYEGSYIEPSQKFGDQYLQLTKELIAQYRRS